MTEHLTIIKFTELKNIFHPQIVCLENNTTEIKLNSLMLNYTLTVLDY